MKLLRFILPFLFTRNWHDGSWEISRPRLIACIGVTIFFVVGILIAYIMQSPVEYLSK